MIVEDHPLFSKGLASLITSQGGTVVGEAANSAEALRIAGEGAPDLAILDLNLGDEDGLGLLKRIKTEHPRLPVLVLSMHDERYYAERVLTAGASGYIMKAEAGNKVMEAIETVLAGKLYLSEHERERLAAAVPGSGEGAAPFASAASLSDRQLQIFSLMGKGLGTLEIAAKLGISTKTIDTHKEHLKLKLRCTTAQELRQLAVEWAGRDGGVYP